MRVKAVGTVNQFLDAGSDALVAFYEPGTVADPGQDTPVWDGTSGGTAPTAGFAAAVATGDRGTPPANLLYLDRDGNGVRDPGEDLLVNRADPGHDQPAIDPGDTIVAFYQPGVDTQLHSGTLPGIMGPFPALAADAVGSEGEVFLHDLDGNEDRWGRWSSWGGSRLRHSPSSKARIAWKNISCPMAPG